jgi:hypothetical protein
LDLLILNMSLVSSRTQSVGFGIENPMLVSKPKPLYKSKPWSSEESTDAKSSGNKSYFNESNYHMGKPKDTWFTSSLNPLAELSSFSSGGTSSSFINSTTFQIPTLASSLHTAPALFSEPGDPYEHQGTSIPGARESSRDKICTSSLNTTAVITERSSSLTNMHAISFE